MKKKLSSLALALALCLSLAVPAFAAEPTVYESDAVRITNVIQQNNMGTPSISGAITGGCICVAPVTITPGAKFGDTIEWHIAVYPADLPEDGDISDLDWDTYADYAGRELTLTEPGAYGVGFASESTETLCNFFITVQAAEDPNPTKPGTTNPGTTTPSFTDVKSGDWFYEAVQWAVEKEITNGTSATKFSPDETCINAQILTFLWRAKGSPEPKGSVSSSEYYAKAAQWAKEQGIADEFDANIPCTRAMTVDYLWKTAGAPDNNGKTPFSDVTDGTDLAKAVAWAVEKGVTTGTSADKFSPDETCTRGQIVTFLYRDMGK